VHFKEMVGGTRQLPIMAPIGDGNMNWPRLMAKCDEIGVKYALAASLIIAVIDVLPVLGCGCVLVPWAVWEFLYGDHRRGIADKSERYARCVLLPRRDKSKNGYEA